MAITEIELAEKVKSKYPQYKDIDDTELVSLVLDRYPEYSTQLGEKEYSKNLLTNSAKTLVSGGVQAVINAGAGMTQSYSMLLGDKSDTSEEAVKDYASQRRVAQRKGGSRMAQGKILAHRKRKNEVIQSLNENSHRLRTVANGVDEQFNIDPEFANSFGGQVLKGFGQMVGNIGAAVVGTAVAGPFGGVAAAVGTIAPQMVSEAVSDSEATLGKSYMDMTEEEKDQVALATAGYATLGTALEFVPVARIPWVRNFLRGKTKVAAGVLKSPSVRREIAKGFAAEGFTEAAQGQLLDSLARATFDDDRELMSWDVLRQRFNEFAVGGIVGGGTSGGIATVQKAARGELFKPKETKEVQTDEGLKEVFDISYTDKNTGNEVKGIEIDAENQEEAIRIAGERLSELAFEGTIVARPKPPPTGGAADDEVVTQPEPGVTVEDEPTEVVDAEPVTEEVVAEEVIPEAEQAELQEELLEEVSEPAPTPEPTPAPQPAPVQEVDSEAIKEQQDIIDDSETRIADLQSEIEIEKSNIKEARARNKKEIADVRKSKLSKEEKTEQIEDLKASLQDEIDDINGNIGIYKEEMSGFKKDLRKAKKKLAGLQPPDVVSEASVTFMPRRFVGKGAETAPGFFQQFSPQQYDDGRFINLETKEDLSDETFEGGSIRIEQGRPVLETSDNPSDTIIDKKASEEGSLVRTNLFKQKAGWKWTKAPEGEPSTIVSVEQGSKHFYTLDFTSSKPLTLKTYPDKKSEPRGRPTTRGKVQLGKVVGEIDIRGKKHPVYDQVTVGEPDVTAGAAPVQSIDFIKGASGDPAKNLASRKRRRAGTGEGKNPSLRLEVNGLPIYIGKDSERGGKSFEGWAEETSAWFTDQEINNAAGWYDSLKSKFTKEFGPERGPKMMLAWLASQQNESPAGGVRNTFRVIDRLTGIKSGKKGGLADAKLEAIFTDTIAEKGLDAKLSDFIDAGMGKRTRTFMGDSPEGGMPFVADVHTGRDSGKLDQATLTRIKRFADNGILTVAGQPASVEITEVKKKKVKSKTKTEPEKAVLRVGDQEVELVRDLTGSPSKGEYEGISDWGNRLTDYLNSIGWKGRTDWIPAEIQAIGWMRTLRQYGLKESDLESSLIENTFRVAAEVDYGLGSKITQIYPDFQKLNEQQKTVITEDVLGFIVPRVQQEMAPSAILRDSEFGIGSWEGSISPSGNFYVMGSDEAANIFTNSLAWVTEQAGTMQAVIGKGGKNQRAVALVGLSNNELSNFVDFVNQLQTGTDKKAAKEAEALRGFSTRAMPGEQGIIVFGLTESKARGVENTLQKFANQYTGADSLTIRNFSAVTKFTENNWKDNQNGESYIREIEQSGSTGNIRERLLRLREQYGQRLAETGQRVAPEVFGGTSIQSRVDQFVEAGKEYLEGIGTDVIAEAAPTDETAQVAPTDPGGTFNQNTLDQFITKNFLPLSRKIGSDIVPNYTVPLAQYNATQGVIEYNPAALAQRDQQYVTAAMREEMIHAAMSKVILKKAKGKDEGKAFKSFMESLGKSLTPEQRTAISQVYQGLETDAQFGAEYSRAAIQQLLYGNVTESFITQGPAFAKIKALLKSVQAYIAKTFKADVTTNPEAAAIIVESARLLQSIDANAKFFENNKRLVDNNQRLVEQKVVDKAMAYSQDVNPNAEVTSEQVAESGKPPSEKKLNINFARKYLFTVSSLLNSIHPRLKKLVRDYYGAIQGEVLGYQKRVAPFFKKYRGIKNAEDRKRLKQLLSYSPVEQEGVDPLIEERDALLRKYDLFNDYQLEIRPVLNELYNRLGNEGIMIGFLEQYFPRSIKDLDKVKNRAGKELRDAFREFVKARNERIEEARTRIEAGNPQPGDVQLSKETTIQIGNEKTAALEAQQWDQFTRGFNAQGRRNLPGNFLSRSEELNEMPDNLVDAYEDPGAAMERYIYNAVTAIQTTRLMGSKFANVPEGLKVPPASELGLLIQELRANGEISMEDADGTVPDIFAMILSPMQVENMFFQLARTFGYGTLLVEFTSTLSQLYDLPFIMLDNGIFGTAVAMFGPRLKGDDFGIDVNQVSVEFASDSRVLEKAVRLGLRATGFTKLDQVMKETNLTANYNRYRKLARGYFKDRNSANSKKFVAELTSMGYSEQEQTQLIADLKKGNRDSAYIRTLLFNKLSETQPLTKAEMALGIVGNPNLRFTVAMKSFMIKQLNFVKDRMINEFIDGVRTGNARKIKKASSDLALLMTFMLLIGLPVDALKDFLAGRLGYMSDYLFNGVFRIFGISRYTAYQARKEGVGQAAFDYVTPVAIQQFVDMTSEVGRVARGERAITESKFVTLLPFSDVINRIFGFQQGRERKEYMRRVREGERPFIVPPGAL